MRLLYLYLLSFHFFHPANLYTYKHIFSSWMWQLQHFYEFAFRSQTPIPLLRLFFSLFPISFFYASIFPWAFYYTANATFMSPPHLKHLCVRGHSCVRTTAPWLKNVVIASGYCERRQIFRLLLNGNTSCLSQTEFVCMCRASKLVIHNSPQTKNCPILWIAVKLRALVSRSKSHAGVADANLETIQQSQYQCQWHRQSLNGSCGFMSLVYVDTLTVRESHCYYGRGEKRLNINVSLISTLKLRWVGLSSSGNLWLGEAWATQRDQDLGWNGVFKCPLIRILQTGVSAPQISARLGCSAKLKQGSAT